MKQNKFRKVMAFCFCLAMITVLLLTGCVEEIKSSELPSQESGTLGEGTTVFNVTVVGSDGNEENFEIHTDKETVGEALLEVGLIDGEQGEYGLYIKTVNGETLDYNEDGKYWAFYIGETYATTGVDATKIDTAQTYTLKAES